VLCLLPKTHTLLNERSAPAELAIRAIAHTYIVREVSLPLPAVNSELQIVVFVVVETFPEKLEKFPEKFPIFPRPWKN